MRRDYEAEKKAEEEFYKKTIDIYDLFSIISELFKDLGLISTGDIDKNKISFKMIWRNWQLMI